MIMRFRESIPLRVMDILESGGFLITNYRKALCDVFEDGVDLVCIMMNMICCRR